MTNRPETLTNVKTVSAHSPGTSPEIIPSSVLSELERHLLVDGFKLVIDLEKSQGSRLVDAATGREWLDLYSFYASQPVGYNHPHFALPKTREELLQAAQIKVANADVYSVQLARFVNTFARVMGVPSLQRYFFIDGGSAAVENALKAAMDWKVRKNLAAGRGERGTEILHFEHAFHGRGGYTLSLTNTDPRKTQYFAKFPWPRVPAPSLDFSLPPAERLKRVIELEEAVGVQIEELLKTRGTDIAAVILEPIQGEGGDNHFRGEWLQRLHRLCDQYELLLILDEVQTGMGMTGRNWCCEHFGVVPDLLVFGKKAQVCGIMAGPRLDEVRENVFRLPSRINSTWGGNFTDYVRATHYLRIIEEERLVEHARRQGEVFLKEIQSMAQRHEMITAARGRGLVMAFDLPNREARDAFWKTAFDLGLLVVRSGERSIRLRPVLDVTDETIETALRLLDTTCRRLPA